MNFPISGVSSPLFALSWHIISHLDSALTIYRRNLCSWLLLRTRAEACFGLLSQPRPQWSPQGIRYPKEPLVWASHSPLTTCEPRSLLLTQIQCLLLSSNKRDIASLGEDTVQARLCSGYHGEAKSNLQGPSKNCEIITTRDTSYYRTQARLTDSSHLTGCESLRRGCYVSCRRGWQSYTVYRRHSKWALVGERHRSQPLYHWVRIWLEAPWLHIPWYVYVRWLSSWVKSKRRAGTFKEGGTIPWRYHFSFPSLDLWVIIVYPRACTLQLMVWS